MEYNFEYYGNIMDEEMMEAFGIVAAVFIGVFAVVGIFSLVMYILRSMALHTIAKRRGLNNPWLAWIPVGQEWIIGSISDQYKYVTQGKVQNRRKLLLIFQIVAVLIGTVNTGMSFMELISELVYEFGYGSFPADVWMPVMATMGVGMLSSAVGITAFVFRQMSMYDLYKSCNPKNCVVFLVLGIFFAVTEPFFLMSCRYKEEGMPPRKAAAVDPDPEENWTADPEPYVYEEYETPVDPAE